MTFVIIVTLTAWLATAGAAGAIPITQVSPGVFRGPVPQTAADYRQLQALGIKTVLEVRKFNRRDVARNRRCVLAHGMNFVHIPVAFRPQKDGSAERAFGALADARHWPIYVHCKQGRDRSGLIVALYRVRCQGWSVQAAYSEMLQFGFRRYLRALERYFWNHARG